MTEEDPSSHSSSVSSAAQELAPAAPPPVAADGAPSVGATAPLDVFQAVYREHFRFVWRSLRRMGVAEANLDDVAQEVFLIVYRKLPTFEARSSLRTWLFGIAFRVASDHRRRPEQKLRVAASSEPGEELPDLGPGPLESLEQRDRARLLESLLATLDEKKRAILILADLEGFSAPEISESLGIKLNTVYSRLRLAREDFSAAVARLKAQQERRER